MRALLCLGVMVLACSANVEVPSAGDGGSSEQASADAAGMAGRPVAGSASGSSSMVKGGSAGASVAGGGHAGSVGVPASAAGGGAGGRGSSVVASAGAGAGGGPIAGTGGSSSIAGAAGEPSSDSGGAAGAAADPCEGVAHWRPTDKITDYTPRPADADPLWQGDLRVFGGILWAAQEPTSCQTYPGHSPGYEGWIQVATCAGGPINETAACQCAAGTCCDGCYLRANSHFCGEVVRAVRCTPNGEEGDYWNLFCDGLTAGDCMRWGPHTKYASGSCASGVTCQSSSVETSCTP